MCTRCVFLGGLTAAMAAPALSSTRKGDPQDLEIALPAMRRVSDTLWLGQLTPSVWIHTTTFVLDGVGYYPANGAIVIDGRESLLIDTGWNDAAYAPRYVIPGHGTITGKALAHTRALADAAAMRARRASAVREPRDLAIGNDKYPSCDA